MRTLRSGKFLPDSPPVMRQSVATVTTTETKVLSTPAVQVKAPVTPKQEAEMNSNEGELGDSPTKRGRGRPKSRRTMSTDKPFASGDEDTTTTNNGGNSALSLRSRSESPSKKKLLESKLNPTKRVLPALTTRRASLAASESKETEEMKSSQNDQIEIVSPQKISINDNKRKRSESPPNDNEEKLQEDPQEVEYKVKAEETTTTDDSSKRVLRSPRKPIPIMSPPMERAKTEICDVCDLKFTRKATLLKHKKIHEVEKKPEPVKQKPAPIKKRTSSSPFASKTIISCDVCNLTFTRKAHLDRHMLLHSGVKPFICDVCNSRFSRKDHMLAHRLKHNNAGETGPSCNHCGMNFSTMNSLLEHIKAEHPEPEPEPDKHVCEICHKVFLQKRYLAAHRKLHMRERPIIGHSMNNSGDSQYQNYGDDDDEGANYNYEEPQLTYKSAASSNSSVVNYGNKPRKPMVLINRVVKLSADLALKSLKECNTDVEVCLEEEAEGQDGGNADEYEDMDYDYEAMVKQSFKPVDLNNEDVSSEDAYAPSKSHSQGSMECSVCGKGFTDRALLRKHYRVHKKRFICRFCGQQMASAGSLMRHNLIHTGRKEFGCNLCSRKFSRKDTLAVHLQAHEKSTTRVNMSRPYHCKLCGASYTMKYNLIRHLKMCHSSTTKTCELEMEILDQNEEDENFLNSGSSGGADKDMVISLNPFDLESLPQRFEGENGNSKNVSNNNDEFIKEEPMDYDENDEANWTSFNDQEEEEQYNETIDTDDQVSEGKYVCNHCGKTFKNSKSLNTHKWYHSREKHFICHICNRGFKYSTDLSRHLNTHSADKGIPQPSTSSGLRPPPPLQPRIGINMNQPPPPRNINSMETRPFGCKLCPQRFNHRSNLSRHTRLLHNSTSIRKRVPNSINLQIYLKKLQAKKSAPMNKISQNQPTTMESRQRQNWIPSWSGNNTLLNPGPTPLSNNEALYTKDRNASNFPSPDSYSIDPNSPRPYSCNICSKSFENKNNLWTHMRIHNKAFSCNVCGLKVSTRGDLILHLRTHTGEKPFHCNMCEWKFSRKSGLNKHIQKYHGETSKVLRPWKYRDERQPGGSLKFKITRSSPQKDDFQIQQLQNREGIMGGGIIQISEIPSLPAGVTLKPLPRLIPSTEKTSNNNTILKTVLQQKSPQVTVRRFSNTTISPIGSNNNLDAEQHQGPRPSVIFLCRKCGTLITGKQTYIDHMKSHQNNNPSSTSSSVPTPLASNNGESQKIELKISQKFEDLAAKPFSCDECDQRFGQKAHLTRHLLSHQNSEAARCDICGKICSSLGFLSRHYQYVHPDKFNPAEQARFRIQEVDKQNNQNQKSPENNNPLVPQVVMNQNQKGDDDTSSEEFFPDESDAYPNTLRTGIYSREPNQEKTIYSSEMANNNTAIQEDPLYIPSLMTNKSRAAFTITRVVPAAAEGPEVSDFPTPCERCGKEFQTKKARSDHVWYCKREKIHRCPVNGCAKEFKLKHDVVRHLKRHTNERRFSCNVCGSKFYHKQDVDRHKLGVHKIPLSNKNPYPCDFCEKHYGNENELMDHLQAAHGIDQENPEIETDTTSGDYQQKNDFQTEEDEEYEEYILDHNNEMNYDKNFQDTMPDPSSFLEQSMGESNETNNEQYDCELCSKSFPTRQKFMYHKYYHEREAKYNCTQCEERFKLRSHLERHTRTYHNDDKPVRVLQCNQCPRKFTREYDLSTHMNKIHNINLNNISPSTQHHPLSILKSTLVMNNNANNEDQEYPSTSSSATAFLKPRHQIGRASSMPSTSTSNKALIEIEVHDELSQDYTNYFEPKKQSQSFLPQSQPRKSFPLMSTKVWSTNDEMQVMGMKDSVSIDSEGRYSCDLCPKIFTEKKSADAHRYYHNREEKYFCPSCGARFKQNSDLQRHVRIHHNSSNPKSTIHCPHCFRSFTDDRYMRMHIRRYHSDLNQQGGGCGGSMESMSSGEGNDISDLNGFSNGLKSERLSNKKQVNGSNEMKQEPMEDDEEDEDDGYEEREWKAKNARNGKLVDLTIVENEDDDENSLVYQNWGEESPTGSGIEEEEALENEESINNQVDDIKEEKSITKGPCSVTCGSCGAALESPSSIANHICRTRGKSATVKKASPSFDCKTCGSSFARSNELILHNRIHTGVKPFHCNDCEKNFVQRADLNAHLLTIHNKQMEVFDCPFCPKQFFVRKSLDSHKRRHHGNIIQFFNCEQCGRQFTAQKFLESHEKNCKGNANSN